MGQNKALLQLGGITLIERVYRRIAPLVEKVVISTNDPSAFDYLALPAVSDNYCHGGPLAGLLAGLESAGKTILAAACDLPFVNTDLGDYLLTLASRWDAVVPHSGDGLQPLFAVYNPSCIKPIRASLDRGLRKVDSFFAAVRVYYVRGEELQKYHPEYTFFNINTREDLARADTVQRRQKQMLP